jgi:hypoxanthine-guanine phosphoribosyltransferase
MLSKIKEAVEEVYKNRTTLLLRILHGAVVFLALSHV